MEQLGKGIHKPFDYPALFRYNDQITITYDVTGAPFSSLSSAWIWIWIPGKSIDAKYNVNPASTDQTKTNMLWQFGELGLILVSIIAPMEPIIQPVGFLPSLSCGGTVMIAGGTIDYYDGGNAIGVLGPTESILLEPGEYRLFTDVYLPESPVITAMEPVNKMTANSYQNPSEGLFTIDLTDGEVYSVSIINAQGKEEECYLDGNIQ